MACELDSVDGANLEATERLLREIAATLPKQNHHSQQQQQQQVGTVDPGVVWSIS